MRHRRGAQSGLGLLEDEVAEQLRRKADGTFLWVALVFKQVKETNCEAALVLEFGRTMSRGLEEMYAR
jgi:hypothetical protein